MKKFKLTHVLGAALIGLASLSSCTDPCADVTCNNGGTCVEGDCVCADNYYGTNCDDHCVNGTYAGGNCDCDTGYEGDACDVETRAAFFGNWNYTTSCAAGQTFTSVISTNAADIQRVTITNLTGFNDNTAYAEINGDVISIPSQTVVDGDGDSWTIQSTGTATLGANTFTITVQYTINGNTVTCPLVYTM